MKSHDEIRVDVWTALRKCGPARRRFRKHAEGCKEYRCHLCEASRVIDSLEEALLTMQQEHSLLSAWKDGVDACLFVGRAISDAAQPKGQP